MTESFASLAKSLVQELQNVTSPDQLDDAGRLRLSLLLEKTKRQVEPPLRSILNLTQAVNGITAARIAIEMGIFDAFAANSQSGMSLEELHPKTKGDKDLLARIMRLLTANGLAEQTGVKKWQLSSLGASLASETIPCMMIIHFYEHVRTKAMLLKFLEETNFQNPKDFLDGPMQYGHHTKQSYFEWIASGPKIRQNSFNEIMKVNQSYRGQDWFEIFPVEERLKVTADETILVDIGGGLGHDAFGFRKRFANLPGRVVLQDLPQVIGKIKEAFPPGLEAQEYDAFTPQPVRGAKAYYLRTVLHDFPEKQALKILGNVRQAMNSNSILLINENVMPEENIPPLTADVDFTMMNCTAALERTEEQWLKLIDAAGFKLVKIWRPTQEERVPNALFEAVLK